MSTQALKRPRKRLAVFLDGTWNWIGNNTNVWRMKSLCADAAADGAAQATYYDIGVNGLVGGTLGKGLGRNIIEAYKWLIEEYETGDDIFIFGFSRGAYTARSLAGLIAKCGLPLPGSPLGIDQIYDRYKKTDEKTIWKLYLDREQGDLDENSCSLEERWMLKYSRRVPIKMVGVWDTVGKIGVPFGRFHGISSSTLGFFHTGLRLSIENAYHAVAIDEHRKAFPPTFWTVRKSHDPDAVTAPPRSLSSVEQRWFIGAHGNVGGGYPSDVLAQPPLRWFIRRAADLGLAFRNEVDLDGEINNAVIADSHREFLSGIYSRISRRTHREIGAPPEERENGYHHRVNETIDASVFEHWRSASYRPSNLIKWASDKNVDPSALLTSVRADDPSIVAPD